MLDTCIICGGSDHVRGTTEYNGEDYPIHEDCYRMVNEEELQEALKKAERGIDGKPHRPN